MDQHVSLGYRAQEGFIYRIARRRRGRNLTAEKNCWPQRDSTSSSANLAANAFVREPVPIEKVEPLEGELQSFVDGVAARQTPRRRGRWWRVRQAAALDLAFEITRQIQDAQ